MRHLIPGPYTFLLPATKLVPRLVMAPKRKTTGIRVPNHPVCQELLNSLGNPIISTSAHLVGSDFSGTVEMAPVPKTSDYTSTAELFDSLEKLVDVIVDDSCELTYQVSTILDFTDNEPAIVRQGLGWEAAAVWI